MAQDIVIVDYGMGNIGSLQNMFKRIGVSVDYSSDRRRIEMADKLILPGVGAFDPAIEAIDKRNLRSLLLKRAQKDKIPFFGVCLGMQLLVNSSEEGKLKGLGLVPAIARKFDSTLGIKVPHMGWNDVIRSEPSPITKDLPEDSRFYFVHSYFVKVENPRHSILKVNYGGEFDAALQNDNVFGAQFHPEKSHRFGKALLKAFVDI